MADLVAGVDVIILKDGKALFGKIKGTHAGVTWSIPVVVV